MRRPYPQTADRDLNCIPGPAIRLIRKIAPQPRILVRALIVVGCIACIIGASVQSAASNRDRVYAVDYSITPSVAKAGAFVELKISQSNGLLRELYMPFDDATLSDIGGDGQISIDNGRIRWLPPADGGRLRWFARIKHLRKSDAYDAFITDSWALFRAEDVIPPTATRTLRRSVGSTRLTLDLPDGWSAVTEYFNRSNVFDVSNPDRRFDRPTGWIILGKIGVRHETIAGVRVVVAAPVGHGVRRIDILAILNWTMPELLRLLPAFPPRLTIVSAGEPMWRGGLSAPASFYIHADRPLISENGTSTILHEAIHVGLSLRAVKGADWIVEGLAEYYGLEILRRSGTISEKRFSAAMSELASWGKQANTLCPDPSTGAVTARAVTLFSRLNREISKKSGRKYDLDDVVRRVANSRKKISAQQLRKIVADLEGRESKVLSDKDVNNCEN